MTITEANAANVVAREVIRLAAAGVTVTRDLEHAIATLLINANKRLSAGYDERSFLAALLLARKKAPGLATFLEERGL